MGLLYPHPNAISKADNDALTGALLGRFPVNSNLEPLMDFVAALGGRCDVPSQRAVGETSDLLCAIPEFSTFGYGATLAISIQSTGSDITGIRTTRSGVGF